MTYEGIVGVSEMASDTPMGVRCVWWGMGCVRVFGLSHHVTGLAEVVPLPISVKCPVCKGPVRVDKGGAIESHVSIKGRGGHCDGSGQLLLFWGEA